MSDDDKTLYDIETLVEFAVGIMMLQVFFWSDGGMPESTLVKAGQMLFVFLSLRLMKAVPRVSDRWFGDRGE